MRSCFKKALSLILTVLMLCNSTAVLMADETVPGLEASAPETEAQSEPASAGETAAEEPETAGDTVMTSTYGVDTIGPTIDVGSITVDKTAVVVGDTVTFGVRITDDLSGVNYVSVQYRMPITERTKSTRLKYNGYTGKYECVFEITEDWEAGIWQIDCIYAMDSQNNISEVYDEDIYSYLSPCADLSAGDFSVSGTNADVTAPTIDIWSIMVDRSEAVAGDRVVFSVGITDGESGVYYAYASYRSPITDKIEIMDLTYNEYTGRYECVFEITESWEAGVWQLEKVYARDVQGNRGMVYDKDVYEYLTPSADLSAGDFSVLGTNADVTAPIIETESIMVDKTDVMVGDTVTFEVRITDYGSGVDYAYISYKLSGSDRFEVMPLHYNEYTGKYECVIDITEKWETGVWQLEEICAEDIQGNYSNIYNVEIDPYLTPSADLSAGDFSIVSGAIGPMIDAGSITVDKTVAGIGDIVTFEVNITDNGSGVADAYVDYVVPYTGEICQWRLSYNEITGKYECVFEITETWEPGVWQAEGIVATDGYGNICYIGSQGAGDFEVIPGAANGLWHGGDGKDYYVENGYIDRNYTGLVKVDGIWYYVTQGALDRDYTGLTKYYGTWYYVDKGLLDWNYTGLTNYYGTWYYVEKGVLNWNYTDLTNYYGTWYYVEKGILNWNYTGLTNYYGTWYYVEKGILNWNYTGLTNYYGTWYYVEKGILDWDYTGLTNYYGTWYYVEKGILDWDYTGLTNYYGTLYYVRKGILDWDYTGFVQYAGERYYVQKGEVNGKYCGLIKYQDTWYYVNKGVCSYDSWGLTYYYGTWYFVSEGTVAWEYSDNINTDDPKTIFLDDIDGTENEWILKMKVFTIVKGVWKY